MAGFADLPADLLQEVFRHVLSGPNELTGAPLPSLAAQWFTLKLTCHHWADVLPRTPVGVDIQHASLATLQWLASVPAVRLLRVGTFGRRVRSKSAPVLDQAACAVRDGPTDRGPRLGELTAAALLASLLGPSASPYWRVADFTQLQVLHLRGALSSAGEPCSLSTSALSPLHHLRHLHLERFTHFDLSGLPPCLRTLKLRYQETPMFSSEPHPALDIVRLPPHTRLDLLEVDSRASLGLLACELVSKCATVAVRATRAYVCVCGDFSAQDVSSFHAPADLRHKAAVMADAALQFLALLAGGDRPPAAKQERSSSGGGSGSGECRAVSCLVGERRLQCIEFSWMCADTLVFVPWQRGGGGPCQGEGTAALEGGQSCLEAADAAAALESAQAAVHEGEEPVVEITTQQIAQLAAQQGQHACAVHAEHSAGHQQTMLLRLTCNAPPLDA